MKKMIVLFAVVAFVASTAVFAIAAKPAKVELKGGKMGVVSYDHAAHEGKVADCTKCHHKGVTEESGPEAKCTSCHGVDAAAPKAKKAFHDQCKGCHKAEKAGPTKCKECHVK